MIDCSPKLSAGRIEYSEGRRKNGLRFEVSCLVFCLALTVAKFFKVITHLIFSIVLSYLCAFIPSCHRAIVLSYCRSIVPSCLRSIVLSFLRAVVPSFLRAVVPSCFRAVVSSCLRSIEPSCYLAFVSSCRRSSVPPAEPRQGMALRMLSHYSHPAHYSSPQPHSNNFTI